MKNLIIAILFLCSFSSIASSKLNCFSEGAYGPQNGGDRNKCSKIKFEMANRGEEQFRPAFYI